MAVYDRSTAFELLTACTLTRRNVFNIEIAPFLNYNWDFLCQKSMSTKAAVQLGRRKLNPRAIDKWIGLYG